MKIWSLVGLFRGGYARARWGVKAIQLFIQLHATQMDHGSCGLFPAFSHGQPPIPIRQSSAKPCGVLPSEWGNPISFSPASPLMLTTRPCNRT